MAQPTRDQLSALVALWEMAQHDHGGAKVVGRFLLGLYNGGRFPFDLTDFRCLDEARFHMCLEVLRMDFTPLAEVHVLLGRFYGREGLGYEFEALAYRLRLKRRCTAEQLKGMKSYLDARDQVAAIRKEASDAVRA
jgi:hypothetical protein